MTARTRVRRAAGLGARVLRLPMQLHNVFHHPANRDDRFGALRRWFAWQVGARLVSYPVIAPFVDDTRLVATPGMNGVTGNIYFGLAEYEEMAFALHLLRADDLFVDVGANAGAYTVLAAGAAGARVVAFEPVAASADMLARNVRLNDLDARVELHRAGVGAQGGVSAFTQDFDTTNRVALPGEHGASAPLVTLDDTLGARAATLIKIDVEGFESEALRGAAQTLAKPELIALIVEINGACATYGFSARDVEGPLHAAGFRPFAYRPTERRLAPLDAAHARDGNVIFVRDLAAVESRLRAAPRHRTAAGVV